MRNKTLLIALWCGLLAYTAGAQSPAATPEATPEVPAVEIFGGYEVTSSVEIGVRGLVFSGSDNKYRSDLNYRPGFRVFDSSYYMRTKDGQGKPFDSFLMTSTGWSADPNGHTRINLEKTGSYRFDSNVRRFTYFNNLNNHAINEHTANTRRHLGDFDLTLRPQSETLRVRFGYSFVRNKGLAFNTYDYQRDEFPIFYPAKSQANDLRAGFDAKLGGFDVNFTQGYRNFRDDISGGILGLTLGNNPSPNSSLTGFNRQYPITGETFFTRAAVHRLLAKRLDFTGRYIYSSTTTRFHFTEKITGRDSSGNTITLDDLAIDGDSKRPQSSGDVGLTLLATDKLRISNTFSFNSYRITGGNLLLEILARRSAAGVTLPPVTTNSLTHRLTSFQRVMNLIEADYQFSKNYAFHVGYRYTKRDLTFNDFDRNFVTATSLDPPLEDFTNHTNTLLAGGKIQPFKRWTTFFDIEHGGADNAFTRLSNYKFTNVRARTRFSPTENLTLNLSVITKDNNNPSRTTTTPPRDFGADVNNRIYNASFDWSPAARLSLSGGYNYQHLTSEVAIIVPLAGVLREGISRYYVREHTAYLDAFVQLHPRASLFASYRINNDRGQRDLVSPATNILLNSYPLQFQSPEVRLAIKLNKRLDWNIGYQYYNYKERFQTAQDYRAHLPYTSLRLYIGRRE